jgi:hypothetical protein
MHKIAYRASHAIGIILATSLTLALSHVCVKQELNCAGCAAPCPGGSTRERLVEEEGLAQMGACTTGWTLLVVPRAQEPLRDTLDEKDACDSKRG